MGIGDWGLGIGDWGLGPIPKRKSEVAEYQAPIPKLKMDLNKNGKYIIDYKNKNNK